MYMYRTCSVGLDIPDYRIPTNFAQLNFQSNTRRLTFRVALFLDSGGQVLSMHIRFFMCTEFRGPGFIRE